MLHTHIYNICLKLYICLELYTQVLDKCYIHKFRKEECSHTLSIQTLI